MCGFYFPLLSSKGCLLFFFPFFSSNAIHVSINVSRSKIGISKPFKIERDSHGSNVFGVEQTPNENVLQIQFFSQTQTQIPIRTKNSSWLANIFGYCVNSFDYFSSTISNQEQYKMNNCGSSCFILRIMLSQFIEKETESEFFFFGLQRAGIFNRQNYSIWVWGLFLFTSL